MMKKIILISSTILTITLLSCLGDGEGGTHVTVTVNDFDVSVASVQHINFNCASILGIKMVGSALEQCGTAFKAEGINACTSFQFEFENLNGCVDVVGSYFNATVPIMTINDCTGTISGTLNGETGSCLLQGYADAPTCRCIIETNQMPTAHNSAFAAAITEGLSVIKQVSEEGFNVIFHGLNNEGEALYDDQSAGNFTIPCDIFPFDINDYL
jgi:hypothetical protein